MKINRAGAIVGSLSLTLGAAALAAGAGNSTEATPVTAQPARIDVSSGTAVTDRVSPVAAASVRRSAAADRQPAAADRQTTTEWAATTPDWTDRRDGKSGSGDRSDPLIVKCWWPNSPDAEDGDEAELDLTKPIDDPEGWDRPVGPNGEDLLDPIEDPIGWNGGEGEDEDEDELGPPEVVIDPPIEDPDEQDPPIKVIDPPNWNGEEGDEDPPEVVIDPPRGNPEDGPGEQDPPTTDTPGFPDPPKTDAPGFPDPPKTDAPGFPDPPQKDTPAFPDPPKTDATKAGSDSEQ